MFKQTKKVPKDAKEGPEITSFGTDSLEFNHPWNPEMTPTQDSNVYASVDHLFYCNLNF